MKLCLQSFFNCLFSFWIGLASCLYSIFWQKEINIEVKLFYYGFLSSSFCHLLFHKAGSVYGMNFFYSVKIDLSASHFPFWLVFIESLSLQSVSCPLGQSLRMLKYA
jgi:hypothetical protein